MENNINDNNINFNVKGHTKIWHKQAGKVYDDLNGELIEDKSNTITTDTRALLVNHLVNNTTFTFPATRWLGSPDNPFVNTTNENLNIDRCLGVDNTGTILARSGILISKNPPTSGSSGNVIHTMNTSILTHTDGALSITFRGVIVKTTSSESYGGAALGIGIKAPANNSAVALIITTGSNRGRFDIPIAYQPFTRTLEVGDTLTIDWTITIG
jgi:hypothetical protein